MLVYSVLIAWAGNTHVENDLWQNVEHCPSNSAHLTATPDATDVQQESKCHGPELLSSAS